MDQVTDVAGSRCRGETTAPPLQRALWSSALLLAAMLLLAAPCDCWALKEGDLFPHFAAPDLSGATVDTKALGGKVILVEFWSIYCSSCVQQMPHVAKLHEKYKDRGLQCIGIDMDVFAAARVKKFIEGLDFKIPYPNIIDAKQQIKALLGVSILPTTIIADSSGRVAMFHVGYKPGFEKDLEEHVRKLLPGK